MTCVDTADEILVAGSRHRDRRSLLRRSDALLERLETLNLAPYGAIRGSAGADLHAVRLTTKLVAAVTQLCQDVGLPSGRITCTRAALDALLDAQAVLFENVDALGEEVEP